MDTLFEKAIVYGGAVASIILGILAAAGTGGLALATGIPEGLILLGFTALIGGAASDFKVLPKGK